MIIKRDFFCAAVVFVATICVVHFESRTKCQWTNCHKIYTKKKVYLKLKQCENTSPNPHHNKNSYYTIFQFSFCHILSGHRSLFFHIIMLLNTFYSNSYFKNGNRNLKSISYLSHSVLMMFGG